MKTMAEKTAIPKDQYEAVQRALAPSELENFEIKPDSEPTPEGSEVQTKQEGGEIVEPQVPEPSSTEGVAEVTPEGTTEPPASGTPDATGKEEDKTVDAELLEMLEGVERKKTKDGKTLYKGISSGEEVWMTLPEMRDSAQSVQAIQKRFREAAERDKSLKEREEELKKREEEFNQMTQNNLDIKNVFGDFLKDPENTDIDLDSDISDPTIKALKKEVTDLKNLIAQQSQSAKQKEEADTQAQQLQAQKAQDLDKVKKTFATVGEFLQKFNYELPSQEDNIEGRIYNRIASEVGSDESDEFYAQMTDPRRIMSLFEEIHGLKPSTTNTPQSDDTPKPPKPAIPSSVKSTATKGGLESYQKEKTSLTKKLQSGKLSPKEEGAIGARLQEVNEKIVELSKGG
jgi:hypothetical protein